MRRIVSSLLLVAAMASTTGCLHITTKMPGTLDMRSDGADVAPDPSTAQYGKDVSRTGIDAILSGDGVQQSGAHVTVVDRKLWALRYFPIMNPSATEEMQAALGTGALRNVKIGETRSVIDVVIDLGGNAVTSFVGLSPLYSLVMPPITVTFEGDRIGASAAAAAAAAPSP
jgi:hypothetical protein